MKYAAVSVAAVFGFFYPVFISMAATRVESTWRRKQRETAILIFTIEDAATVGKVTNEWQTSVYMKALGINWKIAVCISTGTGYAALKLSSWAAFAEQSPPFGGAVPIAPAGFQVRCRAVCRNDSAWESSPQTFLGSEMQLDSGMQLDSLLSDGYDIEREEFNQD